MVKANRKRYRDKNKELLKIKNSIYGKANREKINLTARKYRAKLIEQGKAQVIREWDRQKRRNNPEKYKVRNHNNSMVRRRLEDASPINPSDWIELKIRHGNKCFYCGEDGKLSLDHFVPIAKGGEHKISNIVPACLRCNSRKKDKYPQRFLQEIAA